MIQPVHTVLLIAADPVHAVDLLDAAQASGARIMGPVASLRDVRELLERTQPDVAVVDRTDLADFDPIVSFLTREGLPVTVSSKPEVACSLGGAPVAANDTPPIQLGGYAAGLRVVDNPGAGHAHAPLKSLSGQDNTSNGNR